LSFANDDNVVVEFEMGDGHGAWSMAWQREPGEPCEKEWRPATGHHKALLSTKCAVPSKSAGTNKHSAKHKENGANNGGNHSGAPSNL
jgi:hypothetical protein